MKKIYKICQKIPKLRIFLFIFAFLLFLDNCALAYNVLNPHRPILGLHFHGKRVDGMTLSQLMRFVQQESNRSLVLTYQNHQFYIKPSDIGVKNNSNNTASRILAVGRTGTFLQKFTVQQTTLFGLQDTTFARSYSQNLLAAKVLEIQDAVNQNPTPQLPDFTNNITKDAAPRKGVSVDTKKLAALITDSITNTPETPIVVPAHTVPAESYAPSLINTIRQEAIKRTNTPITITSGSQTLTLSSQDLRVMLTTVKRLDPNNPKQTIPMLRLDDKKLNHILGDFAVRVESETHAEFDDHDARVAIYSQFYADKRKVIAIPTGRSLNRKVLGAQTQPGPKIAYLTFDDGPNAIYHLLVLDILKKYNVKATFFLVGQNVLRDTEVARRTVSEGHVIGNHSLTHAFLPNLYAANILSEIQTTNTILKPFNDNHDITLFRPPYGGINSYVTQDAANLGMKLYLWDVDPRDWSEPATNELVRRVVNNSVNGSDILMHSNHLATVKALPQIIEQLKAQEYTFQALH